jgi:hypothetical protein
MQKVYLLRVMPVWVGLIMLVAKFCQSPLIKGHILTMLNEELLAASALLFQSGALLFSHHNGFIYFFAIVQC